MRTFGDLRPEYNSSKLIRLYQMGEIIATRTSWNNLFPIDQPKRIEVSLNFSEEQFAKLIIGFIPEQMEDKWFIFYEDEWLYCHRSWTGFGIYKARLLKEEMGYTIKELWVERNYDKYKCQSDEADIDSFIALISYRLLNIEPNDMQLAAKKQMSNNVPRSNIDYLSEVRAVLFGVAVGDALGVPVEFESRESIFKGPVTDMIGYGTYNLPPGTFSDDGSLTFCLAEALTHEFSLDAIGKNFVNWYYNNYWTPRGNVFDVGIATKEAIYRLAKGERPDLAGGFDESSNGNGSLMRIAPLLFYLVDKPIGRRYEIIKDVSSITHGHVRSVIACFYYLEFALQLLSGRDKFDAYKQMQTGITSHLVYLSINPKEIALFRRLLNDEIYNLAEDQIFSSGYVLHTLEASIWCLLTTDSYEAAVLKAVNLGEDTDTTGAVTGGLAGLLYGVDNIPLKWREQMARHDDIEDLAKRLADKLTGGYLELK